MSSQKDQEPHHLDDGRSRLDPNRVYFEPDINLDPDEEVKKKIEELFRRTEEVDVSKISHLSLFTAFEDRGEKKRTVEKIEAELVSLNTVPHRRVDSPSHLKFLEINLKKSNWKRAWVRYIQLQKDPAMLEYFLKQAKSLRETMLQPEDDLTEIIQDLSFEEEPVSKQDIFSGLFYIQSRFDWTPDFSIVDDEDSFKSRHQLSLIVLMLCFPLQTESDIVEAMDFFDLMLFYGIDGKRFEGVSNLAKEFVDHPSYPNFKRVNKVTENPYEFEPQKASLFEFFMKLRLKGDIDLIDKFYRHALSKIHTGYWPVLETIFREVQEVQSNVVPGMKEKKKLKRVPGSNEIETDDDELIVAAAIKRLELAESGTSSHQEKFSTLQRAWQWLRRGRQ